MKQCFQETEKLKDVYSNVVHLKHSDEKQNLQSLW